VQDICNKVTSPKKGTAFIISGPSGVGKSTLCKKLLEQEENVVFSVSYTTRLKRKDELQGKDYFFVTEKKFLEMVDNKEFLEWAKVHERYYGTSRQWLFEKLNSGVNILLDIDVQGANQLKKLCSEAVFIFISPPSLDVLKERIRTRKANKIEDAKIRVGNVEKELKAMDLYDYVIENDEIEVAFNAFKEVITKYKV
jgi:guanylate kinase